MMASLHLSLLDGLYAVCRLEADALLPEWAQTGDFYALVRTADELSVVCARKVVPPEVTQEVDWRILKVAGPLEFTMIGVLARLAQPLAEADVSIFVVSTYDTDYLMVKSEKLKPALAALRAAGYSIDEGP
jgi:hypothetical protein